MTWPDWEPGRISMSAGPSTPSTNTLAPSPAAPNRPRSAAPAADGTGLRVRARRGPVAGAGGADHGRVHGELTGGAERALGKVELDPDRGVAAALRAAPRAARRGTAAGRAEELVEQ